MPTTHRRLFLSLAIALLVVIGGIVFMTSLGSDTPQPAAEAAAADRPETIEITPVDPVDPTALPIVLQVDRTRAPLADVVEQFRSRLAAAPEDHLSLTVLGSTLLAQARGEADLELYAEAELVAERALVLAPQSIDARLVLIGAVSARHDFTGARDLALTILEEEPGHTEARTALADADLALGDVDAAKATFLALARDETSPALLSRLSRVAFLEGDNGAAVDLAVDALSAAQALPLRPPDASFYWFQLGFVLFEGGDVDGAAGALERALEISPENPGANELLARVRSSQGRHDDAIAIYRALIDSGPAADLHGELATLLELTGRPDEAAEQIAAGRRLAAQTLDDHPAERRHLVSFLVDHDPATAVQLAQEDFEERQDVYAYDTLAWALYATGEYQPADELIEAALATGIVDADVYFHAGMIAHALDDHEDAAMYLQAALDLSPAFDSVDAPRAAAALAESRSAG